MKRTFAALAVLLAVGCTGAPQAPLAPVGATATANAGPSGETLKATAPELVSPINGVELNDLDPPFLWRHSSLKYANGSPAFTYDFQALNPDGTIAQAHSFAQSGGSTTGFEMTEDLNFGTNYTWRVRARLGADVGPWSTGAFKTADRFTCASLGPNPLAIIQCHRNRFPAGPLEGNHTALYTLIRDVAWDFNRAGVPGGPWGILQKNFGNNCHGYSCDIICRGQGSAQEQFDILLDENEPVWSGHNLPKATSRVDVCEIQ